MRQWKGRTTGRGWFLLSTVSGCLAIVAALLHATPASLGLFFTSDTLYLPSIYEDVFREQGSFFHWSMNPAPNFFPDMGLYFLLEALLGNFRAASYLYPVVQFALIAVGFRWVLREAGLPDHHRVAAAGVCMLVLLLLGALTEDGFTWAFQLLVNAFHMGAFVNALFATALYLRCVRRWSSGGAIALAILVLLAAASDKIFWIAFLVPALIAGGFLCLRRVDRQSVLRPMLVVLFSGAGGHFLVVVLEAASHLRVEQPYAYMAFDRITFSWRRMWESLGSMCGASVIIAGSLVIALLVTVRMLKEGWHAVRSVRDRTMDVAVRTPAERFLAVLLSALYFPVVWFAPVLNGSFDGGDSVRYNYGVIVLALLLCGVALRELPRKWSALLPRGGAMLVFLASFTAVLTGARNAQARLHYLPERVLAVERALAGHDLHAGVADYWDAKLITLFSEHHLRVLPVHHDLALYAHVNRDAMFFEDQLAGQAPMEFGFVVVDPAGKMENAPAILQRKCAVLRTDEALIYAMAPWRFDPSTRRPHGAAH